MVKNQLRLIICLPLSTRFLCRSQVVQDLLHQQYVAYMVISVFTNLNFPQKLDEVLVGQKYHSWHHKFLQILVHPNHNWRTSFLLFSGKFNKKIFDIVESCVLLGFTHKTRINSSVCFQAMEEVDVFPIYELIFPIHELMETPRWVNHGINPITQTKGRVTICWQDDARSQRFPSKVLGLPRHNLWDRGVKCREVHPHLKNDQVFFCCGDSLL